ncbi:hypothetical protein [Hyalangium rubrum]|uniref:Tetratricopeptide repeat protein n=1 Tax=Hyalangium rubrum TaxID=3103134 RepID=A0ABU5GZ83_9BACT|nr:hypothetical protein [Hyalangium sp. s54d21]MDY7226490.1 hypothetical protein [Hyalangium sp. s54d21]
MGLRELKETAHQQYVRGKFAQCAQTYHQILRLAPRDPNMRVRHAEACRRAGERLQAIASYRAAADLLLELGCESRARGALKAALELDPNDVLLQAEVARLDPLACAEDMPTGFQERDELPLLPPLESGLDPVPPPSSTPRQVHLMRGVPNRTPALPPIQRALPAAPSIPPLLPPVLLPAPGMPSTPASGSPTKAQLATTLPPRSATAGGRALPARAATSPLPPRSGTRPFAPPVLQPVSASTPPQGQATAGSPAPRVTAASTLPPRSMTQGVQASAARPMVPPPLPPRTRTASYQAPPPPPKEALLGERHTVPLVQTAPALPAPTSTEAPRPRLEVRRLSPNALAFRCSPTDSWALIRSRTPLEMHLVDDPEQLPPELRDFTLEITVESETESAPSALH